MKAIVRLYGLMTIFIVVTMIFTQMMSFNIRRQELNVAISSAMSSTQIVMQEQIEDRENGTNLKRKEISSNNAYIEEFAKNFYKLTTTNSEFTIKVHGIDYEKGFIDVSVDSTFTMLNGQKKTITSRKTSIVDILSD